MTSIRPTRCRLNSSSSSARVQVFSVNSRTGCLTLVAVQKRFFNVKPNHVARTAVLGVPITGNLGRVLLMKHRIKEGLLREARGNARQSTWRMRASSFLRPDGKERRCCSRPPRGKAVVVEAAERSAPGTLGNQHRAPTWRWAKTAWRSEPRPGRASRSRNDGALRCAWKNC